MERCFLDHMSVAQSIHRIEFKPSGNHAVGCRGRVGQGNDNSARLDRCRQDRQADPVMDVAEDCCFPCVLHAGVQPYLKTSAISCQPTLFFRVVRLTQGPVSAITLPSVTTPVVTAVLDHSLTRLCLISRICGGCELLGGHGRVS